MKMKLIITLIATIIYSTSESFQQISLNVQNDPKLLYVQGTAVKPKVKLFRGVKVYQYLSIPYAEPPIGTNRFQRSFPRSTDVNHLIANKWGPFCAQGQLTGSKGNLIYSEDCLVLNIFTTHSRGDFQGLTLDRVRPVIVFIHGGGFNYGSANQPDNYDGTALAVIHDVVIVTINYRLGVFGFLHLPEHDIHGNMGLWDQRTALIWIRDNILRFGGDPRKVTIYGHDAGAASVAAHIISPYSRNLFVNAIIQSGSIYDLDSWKVSNVSKIFLNKIGCSKVTNVINCLSKYQHGQYPEADKLLFAPVYGDDFLPIKPEIALTSGQFNENVNVLVGVSSDPGNILSISGSEVNPIWPTNSTFVKGQSFVGGHKYFNGLLHDLRPDNYYGINHRLISIVNVYCPTYLLAFHLASTGRAKVYTFYQSQKLWKSMIDDKIQWSPFGQNDDFSPVFGQPLIQPNDYSKEDLILSSIMMNIWTSFAKEGLPENLGTRDWSDWSLSRSRFATNELNSMRMKKFNFQNLFEFCSDNYPSLPESHQLFGLDFGPLINSHDEL